MTVITVLLQPYVKACALYRHSDVPGSIPGSDTKKFNSIPVSDTKKFNYSL